MIDISISNLSKEFEVGKKILDGLTFQVDQGERVGLLGKNGAGKTTLFKVLTGELDWDEAKCMWPPAKGWASSHRSRFTRPPTPWRMCFRRPLTGFTPWRPRWPASPSDGRRHRPRPAQAVRRPHRRF